MILRSTGKVKRGIGSIRQDVNVSIKGHPRVEIKGFQELRTMPQIIANEVERQRQEIGMGKLVVAHVRKANPDGTTTYLRPMPGASRMYPETDVPPLVPDIKDISVPKLISSHEDDLKNLGIGEDLAALVAKEGKAELIIALATKFTALKPAFIAETMTATFRELKREGCTVEKITEEDFERILELLNNGEISKDALVSLLRAVALGKDVEKEKENYILLGDAALEKKIKEIIAKHKAVPTNAIIGIAMKELRGKAEGRKIAEIIQRLAEH